MCSPAEIADFVPLDEGSLIAIVGKTDLLMEQFHARTTVNERMK